MFLDNPSDHELKVKNIVKDNISEIEQVDGAMETITNYRRLLDDDQQTIITKREDILRKIELEEKLRFNSPKQNEKSIFLPQMNTPNKK